MGWITKRHDTRGGGLNPDLQNNGSSKGPLRKIVDIITPGTGMFGRDYVKFACGHEGYATIGSLRGRCRKCRTDVEGEK